MPVIGHSGRQFHRIDVAGRKAIACRIDGREVDVLEGDTVLTALLMHGRSVRAFEFGDARRAGFCLIGACQDCWVQTEQGERLRACSTLVDTGMSLVTDGGANEARRRR